MPVSQSLRSAWAWVNQKTVAPWVLIVLTAVYGFARWEATVNAQSAQVIELKSDTAQSIQQVRAELQRSYEDLHHELIERLDDIKQNQHVIDQKLDTAKHDIDHVKDSVRDLSSDLSIVCDKVSGRCRHR